jgi:hypothetical protein
MWLSGIENNSAPLLCAHFSMAATSTLERAVKNCPYDHQTASEVLCACRLDLLAVTDDSINIPLSK